MRLLDLGIFFFPLALLSCAPATAPHSLGTTERKPTRIETDQSASAIRFIVNGQEEARIDAAGMHVRQGVGAATQTLGSSYPQDASGKDTQ